MTLENLKPWPEKPQAKCTRSLSGWRSMTKWPSAELVYLQTLMASMGPSALGRYRRSGSRISSSSSGNVSAVMASGGIGWPG